MPYSGKDAFAQRDGQERGRCQEVRCRDCKGPDRVHWNGGSLNNEAVLGGSKPPRPRSARRRNSNPQLSINSSARRANAAALLATLNMLIMTAGRWRGLYRTDAGSRLS
jgi:hypothetical protein